MGPNSLLSDVNRRLFPWERCNWGLKLNTHLQVVLTLQMPGATPPLFQCSYRGAYSSTGTTVTLHTLKKTCDRPTTAVFSLSEITRQFCTGAKIYTSLSISFEGACCSGILTDLSARGAGAGWHD